MRKYIPFFLLMALMLAACTDGTIIPEKGNFSFDLPDGYSLANRTDSQCDIVRDDSGTVGGFEITQLKLKDLKDKNTKNILHYLQTDFYGTNYVEFVSMHMGKEHPAVSVSMTAHYEDGTSRDCKHCFFEKEKGVYHMWFDMTVLEQGAEQDFLDSIRQ